MRPIPDRGQHLTRFYGAYANRIRKALFEDASSDAPSSPSSSPPPSEPDPASAGAPASRACWARLIRKVFEVDPLICARCGGEMKVIAVVPQFEGAQGRGQNRSTPSGKGRIRARSAWSRPAIPPELRGVCSSALAKLASLEAPQTSSRRAPSAPVTTPQSP